MCTSTAHHNIVVQPAQQSLELLALDCNQRCNRLCCIEAVIMACGDAEAECISSQPLCNTRVSFSNVGQALMEGWPVGPSVKRCKYARVDTGVLTSCDGSRGGPSPAVSAKAWDASFSSCSRSTTVRYHSAIHPVRDGSTPW